MRQSIVRTATNLARYLVGEPITGLLAWDENGVF